MNIQADPVPELKPIVEMRTVSKAWASVRSHPIWILGGLILTFISFGLSYVTKSAGIPLDMSLNTLSLWLIAGCAASAVITALTACYQREYIRSLRGEKARLSGMFNAILAERPLLLLGVFLYLPSYIAWFLVRHYGLDVGTYKDFALPLVHLLVAAVLLPCEFARLFIADQGDGVVQAVMRSYRFVMKAPFSILWVMIVASFASMLGVILCGIGVVLTYPIMLLTPAAIYEENRAAGVI